MDKLYLFNEDKFLKTIEFINKREQEAYAEGFGVAIDLCGSPGFVLVTMDEIKNDSFLLNVFKKASNG